MTISADIINLWKGAGETLGQCYIKHSCYLNVKFKITIYKLLLKSLALSLNKLIKLTRVMESYIEYNMLSVILWNKKHSLVSL